MINTKYYIRVQGTATDEVGFIYHGVRGVIPPTGYVAVQNYHCTRSAIEIVPEDDVAEIEAHQYTNLEAFIVDGDDPSEAIEEVLAEVDPRRNKLSHAGVLRRKMEAFKRAAYDLSVEWSTTVMQSEEIAGVNVNYPFMLSFDEIDFESWGERETELCPLEKAVLWIEAHDTDADIRHLLSDELSYVKAVKEVMKILMTTVVELENQATGQDLGTINEIYTLIDEL